MIPLWLSKKGNKVMNFVDLDKESLKHIVTITREINK